MKKHLFFVALASVALASCVKNEVESPAQKEMKIGFASPVLYSNLDTKAEVYGEIGSHKYAGTETVYSYPREEMFKIFAVEHEGNLVSWNDATPTAFNGQNIAWDNSLDAWVPHTDTGGYYYWPDNAKLSFAAMSPAELDVTGAAVAYDMNGLTVTDFVIADDPADQYDLLYSERAINKTSSNGVDGAGYYSGVPITFKHALSSIHFSLKTDVTSEPVALIGITLKNAKNTGNFTENITDEETLTRAPYWTPAESSPVKDYVSFTGNVNFPLSPQYVSALAAQDGTDDDDESHALLLMPQVLGNDVVVEVNYKVGDEVKTRTVQLNQYPANQPVTEWKVGTKYTYRLIYSKDAQIQDIIYFAPSTEGWEEGTAIEVNL